jgi:hypothetical protein
LSLGFRHDGTTGWNEANGRASTFIVGPEGALETDLRISSSTFMLNRTKFLPQTRTGLRGMHQGQAGRSCAAGLVCTTTCRMYWDTVPIRTHHSTRLLVCTNIPPSQLPLIPGQPVNGGLVAPNGVQQNMYTPTILSLRIEQELTPNTMFAISYGIAWISRDAERRSESG